MPKDSTTIDEHLDSFILKEADMPRVGDQIEWVNQKTWESNVAPIFIAFLTLPENI